MSGQREVDPGGAVDWTVLETLAQDMGDDTISDELVAIFLAELPARRAALATAGQDGDAEVLAAAAHALKSAAATVGALSLSAICAGIESVAREGALDAARSGCEAAVAECDRVATALAGGR